MSDGRAVVWIVASGRAAARWAPALEARDLVPCVLAWSEVRPLDAAEADVGSVLRASREDLIVFTSANAVRFLPDASCTDIRAACVGEATARAARAKGFDVVHVGREGGVSLARELIASMPDLERVNYLHQTGVRPEGCETLAQAGVGVDLTCSYAMEERADFGARVSAAQEPAAVALGSPRAADALVRALETSGRRLGPRVVFAALGDTTARRAVDLFGDRVVTAGETTPAALTEAIARRMDETDESRKHHD